MNDINIFVGTGKVADAVDFRQISENFCYAKTSLQIKESYRDKEGVTKYRSFYKILKGYNTVALAMRDYLCKERKIFVQGSNQKQKYVDKNQKIRYLDYIRVVTFKTIQDEHYSDEEIFEGSSEPNEPPVSDVLDATQEITL